MRATINYTRLCIHMSIFLLAAVVMVFNSGCNKHLAGRPNRIQLVENEKPTPFEKELIDLEDEYDKPQTDTQTRQNIRDQYSRKMIAIIDKRYNDFLDDLVIQRKGFDASADITAISLDTASVLFTPVTTKSILAGLSGLTTSGKTAINKVYFYEQTLPVLITQMESNRQSVLADIMEGLAVDDNIYPLHHALRDLNRYFAAGTIDGALVEIQKQAAKKADEAQMRIRQEIEDEIKSGRARRKLALEKMVNETSFIEMRTAIIKWWGDLDEDEQWEQIDVIAKWANKHGVSLEEQWFTESATGVKVLAPNSLESILDSLEYNEANRLFYAEIVRNAIGIELPK